MQTQAAALRIWPVGLCDSRSLAWTKDTFGAGEVVELDVPLAELSDETLVDRSRGNDHEAFTELVDRYKNRIHWVVTRMVGPAESEDFTQDVFLRVYRALPTFRSGSKFSTWIYKIAHNLCLSELRKRGRRGAHVSFEEEGEEKIHWLLPGAREGLEEDIERRDLSETVRQLIGRLPANYREVLTLFYLNQVRYEEIAEIMGIPLGTVKTYLHRARLRLRDLVLSESGLAEDLRGQGETG